VNRVSISGRWASSMFCATVLSAGGILPSQQAFASTCSEVVQGLAPKVGVPVLIANAVMVAESGSHGPLTLNIAGDARYPVTDLEAEAAINVAVRGGKNVDIGCMQVSSKHNGKRVSVLASLLDPFVNVETGLAILVELRQHYGNWRQAVGAYHNAGDPGKNLKYRCTVAHIIDPTYWSPACRA